MRSKSIVLLCLALGCGLVASIGISQIMDRSNDAPVNIGETEPVFVALTDINANELLTPQTIKLEEWPKGKIQSGVVTRLDQVEGKRARQKIFAGEPILEGKLRGADAGDLPSDGIPKGFRVVNVRVDSVSGTGLLVPGDRVDVLVFLNKNTGTGIAETSARTILQDIKVYAVDSTFVGKQEHENQLVSGKTISLLVTPSQAEKVTLASEMGNIRLIIRSPEDDADINTTGSTVADILGGKEKNSQDNERKPEESDGKKLEDFLNGQQAGAAPMPVITMPQPVASAPWKMVLLEGSAMREVDFPQDDGLPVPVTPDVAPVPEPAPPPLPEKPPAAEAGTREE